MILVARDFETKADRSEALKQMDDDHEVASQTPPPCSSPDHPSEINVRNSIASTILADSHAKVRSWLQINNDDFASGNHDGDNATYTGVTPEATFSTIAEPEPDVELEGRDEQRLPSSTGTEQTQQTIISSKEAFNIDSPATNEAPLARPRSSSLRSTHEMPPSRPGSPSGISDLSLFPSRYTPSIAPSVREHSSQRINPKKARLKNGIHRLSSPPPPRTQYPFGRSSSAAAPERPTGYYGIGKNGGFPPEVAYLAFCKPHLSTPPQTLSAPVRIDSKIHAKLLPISKSIDPVNEPSTPPMVERCVSLRTSKSQMDSLPSQQTYSLTGEASQSSTSLSVNTRDKGARQAMDNVSLIGDVDVPLECDGSIPKNETCYKTGKHRSLPTVFCAVAPSVLGHYGEEMRISMFPAADDPLSHYVPLSDACPLLVGSLLLRHRLSVQDIDIEDAKVYRLLAKHDIAIERVSKADQILLWHLAIQAESRDILSTTSNKPFSHVIFWMGASKTYSHVEFTLNVFLKWLKCKEQAFTKTYQVDDERSVTRSTSSLKRMMSHRCENNVDQGYTLGGTVPSLQDPAAVWLNVYRLLRSRGMSEEQLEREDFMNIMLRTPDHRSEYMNKLRAKCRSRTLDNADLDRRYEASDKNRLVPQMTYANRVRSPSYSVEAKDTIVDLPGVSNFKRPHRKGSIRRSSLEVQTFSRISDWDTPLAKLPLKEPTRFPKPLLSDIELPRNYVPPNRRRGEEEDVFNRITGEVTRRNSVMSSFSRSTTSSDRAERTRWGRFKKRVRMCFPPCCCG